MEIDFDACYRAARARDRRFDGRFFVGITSTRIYCRPICRARDSDPVCAAAPNVHRGWRRSTR